LLPLLSLLFGCVQWELPDDGFAEKGKLGQNGQSAQSLLCVHSVPSHSKVNSPKEVAGASETQNRFTLHNSPKPLNATVPSLSLSLPLTHSLTLTHIFNMNHETKEVILKVTDVVKTVVHFGFIPFVIYLGAFSFHSCADNGIIVW
jgi:hypothetical protein